MLREVQRYAPPAPAESEIDARMDETRRRLPAGAALAAVLRAHGLSEARLRAWLRDDLRTQAYLAQRFASASSPSDTEVSAAYTAAARRVRRGRADVRAGSTDRARAADCGTPRELLADWLSDLRRRTDVVILAQ